MLRVVRAEFTEVDDADLQGAIEDVFDEAEKVVEEDAMDFARDGILRLFGLIE